MNQTLTQANFASSVRYFIGYGLVYASAKGWISVDMATNLGVLTLALIPVGWAYYSNWAKKQDAQAGVTAGVQAGVAMANDPNVQTPAPAAIGPILAKSAVATYVQPN